MPNTNGAQGYALIFNDVVSPNFQIGGDGNRYALCQFGSGVTERHLGTANVLFTDGHVKALNDDRLVAKSAIQWPSDGNYAYSAWSVDAD